MTTALHQSPSRVPARIVLDESGEPVLQLVEREALEHLSRPALQALKALGSELALQREHERTLKLLGSQELPRPAEGIRLNLGCGGDVRPGWINIDCSTSRPTRVAADGVFLNLDLRRGLPFPTAAVDFIYSSHFFEHLERADAVELLKDCFQALRSGGRIRFALPNLRGCFEAYLARDPQMWRDLERLGLTPRFADDETLFADVVSWAVYEKGEHRHFIDPERLGSWLRQLHFVDAQEVGFDPTVDVPDEVRRWGSFYFEARRP